MVLRCYSGPVAPNHKPAIVVAESRSGEPFFEAKWRAEGHQIKRRVGPAWLDRDGAGWAKRRGKVAEGHLDERMAFARALEIVADYTAEAANREQLAAERAARDITFGEIAAAWLRWQEDVKGAKASSLRDYRYLLADSAVVMSVLGDRAAAEITTRDVETLLAKVSTTGACARTVNKYRAVLSAVFGYACKPSAYGLAANPVRNADRRREPAPTPLAWYSPEEVEFIARALEDGHHRDTSRPAVSDEEILARQLEDHQDAEIIRVAAYAGLRQGELLALRWADVDVAGFTITVQRALSAGVESSPKSGQFQRVPLADVAAAALDRVSRRENFTTPADLVFCNAIGRHLDGSALRRRYKRAQKAAGIRPLRFHDLRHTFASRLATSGIDVVSIQSAMGHAHIATTSRYLHARPAFEQAKAFSAAFSLD